MCVFVHHDRKTIARVRNPPQSESFRAELLLRSNILTHLLFSCPCAHELLGVQPLFVRQDTPTHFSFRIRNLPYDSDNYLLDIDAATQEIVLKTKNKKSVIPPSLSPCLLFHELQPSRGSGLR